MFKNFLKVTFRNFSKNKSYVFINLVGLGLSLACCIVAYLNWKYSATYDRNHVNHERIYKLQIYKEVQKENFAYGISPLPLGKNIEGKVAGISHVSRYNTTGLVIKKDLKVFNQNVAVADEDFFEMFTFPFKYGNKEAFLDRSKIILSAYASETYFGEINPVGEIVTVVMEDGRTVPFTVGGVLEPIPQNSSINFRAITHFDNFLKIREMENTDWGSFVGATFVMTEGYQFPKNIIEEINSKYVEIQNRAREDFKISSYHAIQLSNLGSIAEDLRANSLNAPPPKAAANVPIIMAGLMLLIACFNFTNTSIAISSKRLKEIGIRKVMGSNRKQLILQFMGENLVLAFISMIAAIGFATYLVPAYGAMWDFISLELDLISDPEIYLFLFGMLLFTSLIAGGYPSLYISGFQPVNILRGSMSLGGSNLFSRILLGVQYMLTIVALISALAFANNATYQRNRDMGFEKDDIIGVRIEDKSEYERFSNVVAQMPEIEQSTGTTHHIGWWTYGRTLRTPEVEVEAEMMALSLDYQELMNLQMVEGRYFDKDLYDFDLENSIIVNEAMVKEMGWQKPLGTVVSLDDSTRLTVIGVMEDFYMWGFFNPVAPFGFRLANKETNNFVVAKGLIEPTQLYELLEEKWYEVSPNTPFNAQFVNQSLSEMDLVNKNIMKMFQFLGLLALVLSSIGLYTLVSLNIIKRIKEIGVRKVLGATIRQILVLINAQFFWLLLIFSMIGAGLAYLAIDALMGMIFHVYLAADYFTVLVPFFTLLLIAVGLASFRIYKAATKNPVESLRYE